MVTGIWYWGSGWVAIHDGAGGCRLGGASGLDQSLCLASGFHGFDLGGCLLYSGCLGRIRGRPTSNYSCANGCSAANCPNCYGLAYGRMSRFRWGWIVLARGRDWGDRRTCRSVWRLSGSRRTGSRSSRSGRCDCSSGRPGCNWARTAAGFQILKIRSSTLRKHSTQIQSRACL